MAAMQCLRINFLLVRGFPADTYKLWGLGRLRSLPPPAPARPPRLGPAEQAAGSCRAGGERARGHAGLPTWRPFSPCFGRENRGSERPRCVPGVLPAVCGRCICACCRPSSEGLVYTLRVCPQVRPPGSPLRRLRLRWAEALAQRVTVLAARLPLLRGPWSRGALVSLARVMAGQGRERWERAWGPAQPFPAGCFPLPAPTATSRERLRNLDFESASH